MLEDRDYMRQPDYEERRWRPSFYWRWSWTTALLASYVVVLIAELITGKFFPNSDLFFGHMVVSNVQGQPGVQLVPGWLALSKEGIENGYLWQLVTYQFMHAGWLHLILNGWAIFVFGTELERLLGGRRFLTLMLVSGAVGGIFQVLTAMLWPGLFGGEVVGASAGAFGLVAAFAMIFPERELTLLLFFVIPVHLRARTLLIVSAVIAVLLIIFPITNIANAAHLGGMAMGWFYVKAILKNPALLGAPGGPGFNLFRPMKKVTSKERETGPEEIQESDVDAVLDKISAKGIQSLTARERALLETARKKMARQ